MAVTGKQFVEGYENRRRAKRHVLHCLRCGQVIHETITGCRKVLHGYVCNACLSSGVAEAVRERPIRSPKRRSA